ncbi:MAG: helix-turn-helix transcriptional regulator [Halioglobus sp.]|nr:helix-turn-helix transcriptional regulator [Halioglobus sp.]
MIPSPEYAPAVRASTSTHWIKAQDTSYRRLLEEARLDCADALLADARLNVAEVAQRLGYSDPANFGRAFRKLTGTTPAAWRRR